MLSYDLSTRGDESLYEYLYRCIRHDIAHGAISAGQKLPSKRAFASHLGVSLVTVEAAYRQLIAEGYILARERSGYYACELPPAEKAGAVDGKFRTEGGAVSGASGFDGLSKFGDVIPGNSTAENVSVSKIVGDFVSGDAATKMFPYSTWAKTVRGVLSDGSPELLSQAATTAGSPQLRQAIANYLRAYRGINASSNQIVVGAGSQVLYQLVVQLLGREKIYAIETPGYPLLARMYSALGAPTRFVPLDEQGMSEDSLRSSKVQVAHVMPVHQFPTGVAMSAARRRALLNWTREEPDRFVIEDDYDSEFRMTGRPIAPLFSIDVAGKVLYLNSFAKSLGSAFRIAYLVLPPELANRFSVDLGFYSNTVSPLDQLALASFIEQGYYERHVNRLRARARRAQDALVGELRNGPLSKRLHFHGLNGGLHFVMELDDSRSEEKLVELAARKGVLLSSLKDFFLGTDATFFVGSFEGSCFVLRYSGTDEGAARASAHALEAAWR